MKLRRLLINGQPQVEALNSSNQWVRLYNLDTLQSISEQFGVNQDLATNILSVLALGSEGLAMLKEKINACSVSNANAVSQSSFALPFQPLSFRDFLLFEKHFTDASRGFVKQFLPQKYKITQLYEKITNKTFPKFKPASLWYKQPLYYFGNHLNFTTSNQDVYIPHYTKALDYELELGAVIVKSLFNASAEEAERAIGGYVVLNDWSARDVQMNEMQSGFGPQKAKHFLNGISPIVVTADEINNEINKLKASVYIDGQKVADCSTGNMQYSLGEAIAYVSKDEHLYPGELFGSGTMPGGCSLENGHWLKSGNTLTLQIDKIGALTNKVIE
jgi:2-keto-4-pentenoate hydratase/2-oxohepta-3-ene-1,7-dioic acid hydratase in catechol pathway